MVFEELSPKMQKIINKRFDEPTEAQNEGIPPIRAGKNTLVISQTGSGKTEACLLPVWDRWLETDRKPISILYITPLKALNRDILDRIMWWAEELDMEVAVRHGDTTQYERQKQSEHPPHMMIMTPEMLGAVMPGSNFKEHFKNLNFVVIDEVHELAASKRGVQLSVALERLRNLAGDFQTIGLSATVGSPEKVAKFLTGDRDYEIVKALSSKEYDIIVDSPDVKKEDKKLAEKLYLGDEIAARLNAIKNLIEEHRSSLIFTNTRVFAEVLSSRLRTMNIDFEHDIHHGSLGKEVRLKTEEKFKNEELKTIVCTSSLELGIDIGSIDLVLQYMSPRQASRLIQRVGRSGHHITKVSKGILISTEPDDIFESVIVTKHGLEGNIEPIQLHRGAWDVLSNQILALALDKYKISKKEAFETIKKAYCFKDLKKEEFEEMLEEMSDLRLIWNNEKTIGRGSNTWNCFYNNLSMIPSIRQFKVVNGLDDTSVGVLDEEFVALHASDPGDTFIVKGRPWKVIGMHRDQITVEPVEDIEATIPGWEGEMIPVPHEIGQGVGKIRREIAEAENPVEFLVDNYPVSEAAAKKMSDYIEKQKDYFIPDDKTIVFERQGEFLIIHSCFGSLVNETLGRVISVMLSSEYGSVGLRSDAYRITIKLPEAAKKVEGILKDLKPEEIESLIRVSLDRSELFKWRFLHIAKRFGAIRKDADYSKINVKRIIRSFRGSLLYEEAMREVMVDKMDVGNAKKVVEDINNGNIEIRFEKGPSPIGKAGLQSQAREVIQPEKAEREIFEVFKERLMNTKMRLLCMKCGNMTPPRPINYFDEDPECNSCESHLLSVVKPHHREYQKVVNKSKNGKSLDSKQQKILNKLERSSDLVVAYGKDAIIVQAGRGLGPQTSSRVLAKMKDDRDDMMKDILEEERKFARTRRFWN